MQLNYVEVYINDQERSFYKSDNDENNKLSHENMNWDIARKTIENWSKIVQIDNIGISGWEPLMSPELNQWLYGIRTLLPQSYIYVITNGYMINLKTKLIEEMIDISLLKLCIVLDEQWNRTLQIVLSLLDESRFRFLKRNVNDPFKGIQIILIDKERAFFVELYLHRPIQFRKPLKISQNPEINELFQAWENRKNMPVLSDGFLFKCGKAFRIWKHFKNEPWIIQYLEGASVHYTEDINHIETFLQNLNAESTICSFCYGCIECVVQKKYE